MSISYEEIDIETGNNLPCVICLDDGKSDEMMCPAEKCNVYCCEDCQDRFDNWIKTKKICPQCKERDLNHIENNDEDGLINSENFCDGLFNEIKQKIIYFILNSINIIPIIYIIIKSNYLYEIIRIFTIVAEVLCLILFIIYTISDRDDVNLRKTIRNMSFLVLFFTFISILHNTEVSYIIAFYMQTFYYNFVYKMEN